MIARELEDNLNFARVDARRRGLEMVTVEHLTYVLICENTAAREMLVDFRADIEGLKQRLVDYLAARVPGMRMPGERPKTSAGVHRVLQRARAQAEKAGQDADGVHVLSAVFAEPESYAAYFMQKYGVERLSIVNWLTMHGGGGADFMAGVAPPQGAEAAAKRRKPAKDGGADLVARAREGELEDIFGRDAEVSALVRILSHKYKNNPLLVGEAGVGKTSIVHALAHRIADGDVPPPLAETRLQPLSMTDLVADTKYRGDFEQRIRQLMERCKAHGKTILFIDEIHTIVGAGAVSGTVLDAANALKPLLGGEVRLIGATTFAEYRRHIDRDGALARRFQKIEVREPEAAALRAILDGVIPRLSAHHNVRYAADAADAAAALSSRYLPNRFLPDKAIDLLDAAGAARWHDAENSADADGGGAGFVLGEAELRAAALRAAGLPPAAASPRLMELGGQLRAAVLDQPAAADALSRAVLRAQMGFLDGERAAAAFLFAGPTGVGKTEMAKQLAVQMGLPLLRYDMSEYMERHAVSRLIGAPPGYVGFEQGGKLAEDVFRHPNAVVLFDEAEKAHPDVLNILLQILDYGVLTDNGGRRADFSNAMVILTSNIGSAETARATSGFAREDGAGNAETTARREEALNRFFSPEFRNRLDAIIHFRPLSAETFGRIADMRLAALLSRLSEKSGAQISVSAALRAALRRDGVSAEFGARQLERLLRERITEPLALAAAEGRLSAGGRCRLELDDGVVVARCAVRRVPARRAPARRARKPALVTSA